MDAGKATVIAAIATSVGALVVSIGSAVSQIFLEGGSDPDCSVLLQRHLALVETHPRVARLYAAGAPGLPTPATKSEIEACGDPILLFRAMTSRPGRG